MRWHGTQLALTRETSDKAAALAQVEAAGFQSAELRQLNAIARENLETCHDKATSEVDAAWRKAAAADSGHAAQTAAFAAVHAELDRLRLAQQKEQAKLAELEERARRMDETERSYQDLEKLLIEAKLEIAMLKASAM